MLDSRSLGFRKIADGCCGCSSLLLGNGVGVTLGAAAAIGGMVLVIGCTLGGLLG